MAARWFVALAVLNALSLLVSASQSIDDLTEYPFATWMGKLSPWISDKNIFELTFPGATKAGMSSISSTANANDDFNAALRTLDSFESRKEWALRQRLSVYELLMNGVRFLDLQFEFDGSSTYFAHNGLYGLSLDEVEEAFLFYSRYQYGKCPNRVSLCFVLHRHLRS